MRLALFSDIHGNLVALKAVLADIEARGVDDIICLGDVATLGPRPHEVIALIRELDCPCIIGNHDAFMLDPDLIHTYTKVPIVIESVDWCREQLSADELDFFKGFVPSLRIALPDGRGLFIYHATPRSHMEDLLATTPPEQVDEMLAGHDEALMIGGHTHIQMFRQHRGRLLINPGSVGLPFKEYTAGQAPEVLPHAEYAIIQADEDAVSVELKRVALDKAELRAALEGSDYPLAPRLREHWTD